MITNWLKSISESNWWSEQWYKEINNLHVEKLMLINISLLKAHAWARTHTCIYVNVKYIHIYIIYKRYFNHLFKNIGISPVYRFRKWTVLPCTVRDTLLLGSSLCCFVRRFPVMRVFCSIVSFPIVFCQVPFSTCVWWLYFNNISKMFMFRIYFSPY